jgi:TolA-binding protein
MTLSLPSCIALRDDVKRDVATAKLQIEADRDAQFKVLKDDLHTQISGIEKRVSSLEKSLDKMGVTQKSQLNLSFSNIDELKLTILEMNRRIDQLDVSMKATQNDKTAFEAIDLKIAELEQENENLKAELEALREAAKPVRHVTITKKGKIRLPESKKTSYKELVKLTRSVKPADESAKIIRSGWSLFRKRWGSYRPCDQLYWIAESYYLEKKYSVAITKFKEIDVKYKKCGKREASYLRIAWSLYYLDKKSTAGLIIQAMKAEFPKSNFAKDIRKLEKLLKKSSKKPKKSKGKK